LNVALLVWLYRVFKQGEAFMFVLLLFCLFNSLAIISADINGPSYSKINDVQRSWARPLVDKIKEDITKKIKEDETCHLSVLSIGCGTGEIEIDLAKTFPNNVTVGAIDPTQSMISYASLQSKDVPNVVFRLFGVPKFLEERVQNGLDPYAMITSFSALHWLSLPDLKKTMKAMHNVLVPDGRCYLLLAGKRADKQPDFLTQAVDTTIQQEQFRETLAQSGINELEDNLLLLTSDEFGALAGEAGFVPEKLAVDKVEYTFQSAEKFKEWLDVVSPYKKLLGDKHGAMLTALMQQYLKVCPANSDGSLLYPDYMLYAILKKQ
jgi:SAM-dependent methyltransferase